MVSIANRWCYLFEMILWPGHIGRSCLLGPCRGCYKSCWKVDPFFFKKKRIDCYSSVGRRSIHLFLLELYSGSRIHVVGIRYSFSFVCSTHLIHVSRWFPLILGELLLIRRRVRGVSGVSGWKPNTTQHRAGDPLKKVDWQSYYSEMKGKRTCCDDEIRQR